MARTDGSSRLRRRLVGLVLAGVWWTLVATTAAVAAPHDLASRPDDGSAVVPDDLADLSRALRNAIDPDLDAVVVVLPTPVDDLAALAASVASTLEGPVVVVTPDGYAISAAAPDRSMARGAPGGLVPSRIADDLAFFMAQSNPSGMSWGVSLVIPVLAVALLAAGQTVGEYRATNRSNVSALRAEWKRLEARADALADPVLELSTRIELDGRQETALAFRGAASEYGHLRDTLGRPPSAPAVDGIRATLDRLERRFDRLAAMLDGS